MCDMWIAQQKKDLIFLCVGSLWPITNRFVSDRKKICIVVIAERLSFRKVKEKGEINKEKKIVLVFLIVISIIMIRADSLK